MELIRSTWKEFLNIKEFQYIGSGFNKDEEVINNLKKEPHNGPLDINRVYVTGKTALQFKTPNGDISWLDKKGKVSKLGSFFIIQSSYTDKVNNTTTASIIVYKYK